MKILVAGDLVPQNRVSELFENKEYDDVLQEVNQYTRNSSFSIVNLEAPIVLDANSRPIQKEGPNLKTNSSVIGALQYAGFDAVTLANNHFRDYGDSGVNNTISQLKNAGIDFVGAGANSKDASLPLYRTIGDDTLAIINCCENEFSIASKCSGGSNPLNPIQQYYAIKNAKESAKFVIVITHGGIEHFSLPTPRMVETYKYFIDCGADAVINHHQHCYSGYEVYKGKPIFYGLGNFCFDRPQHRNDFWNYGYMVQLELGNEVSFQLIPYNQCSEEPSVKILSENEYEDFLQKIERINDIICDNAKLEVSVERFFERSTNWELSRLEPYSGRLLSKLYSMNLLPSFITEKKSVIIRNRINCESHREKLLYALNLKQEK